MSFPRDTALDSAPWWIYADGATDLAKADIRTSAEGYRQAILAGVPRFLCVRLYAAPPRPVRSWPDVTTPPAAPHLRSGRGGPRGVPTGSVVIRSSAISHRQGGGPNAGHHRWQRVKMTRRVRGFLTLAACLPLVLTAAAAVIGQAPLPASAQTVAHPGPAASPQSIVQLGDSVASGEGTLYGYRYDAATQTWTGGNIDAK